MNARNRFWRMLLIVASDSWRARTIPVRSPLRSVMPALSIATSVPDPMAMPTSAAASAGASFTPSPAIATMRPSRLSASMTAPFLIGQDLGLDLRDAEAACNRFGRSAVVAGEHDDTDALRLKCCEGLRGRRLYGIGDGDHAGRPAIHADEDCGRSVPA